MLRDIRFEVNSKCPKLGEELGNNLSHPGLTSNAASRLPLSSQNKFPERRRRSPIADLRRRAGEPGILLPLQRGNSGFLVGECSSGVCDGRR